MAEWTCRIGACHSGVGPAWGHLCAVRNASLWIALFSITLVLGAVTGCDAISLHSGGAEDVGDQIPVGKLGVLGTFREGELRVHSVRWRIGIRQISPGTPNSTLPETDEGPIRARLLDASGLVLMERTAFPTPGRGEPSEDVPQEGEFLVLLSVEDPSRVVELEVTAGEELYRERAESPLSILLDTIPPVLVEPVTVGVAVHGRPRELLAEVHGARYPGRTIPRWADSLRIDPSRYGPGRSYFVVLGSDGLAADLAYASSHINVPFAEHLEIHLDGVDDALRLGPGQPYLFLEPSVVRVSSPSESSLQIPFPGTVDVYSDVDGSLLDRDLSPDHPEIYLELAGLPAGPRVLTIAVSLDGLRAERSLVLELHP